MDLIPVNKILPYSIVDGPGNRVAIFVQACNISCLYCHNPETQRLCNHCGQCVNYCPGHALSIKDDKVIWDITKCLNCDTCIKLCPNHSSPKVTWMSSEEIYTEIMKSRPFIRGITVSGGECMMYAQQWIPLFKKVRQSGLTVLMDSNGTFDYERYPELLENIDGVMLDVKSWNEECFHQLTGGSDVNVKKNLKFLADAGKLAEIRVVCLPGKVDVEEVIKGMDGVLSLQQHHILLKLIRFRRFGVRGELENQPSPDDECMNAYCELAKASSFDNIMVL